MREAVLGRHRFLAACAGSAVLWAAFFLLLGPRYATNDDPLIAMLPAGTGFASAPDEHLVFTNVVIGLFLERLHAAAPGLPWYGLYLLATHVVAQTALLYAALRVEPRGTRLALYLAWFAVAAVPFADNLHFTTTAFVTAQAGVLLALSLLERPPAPTRSAMRAESVERSAQDGAYRRALEPLRAAPERHYVLWGTFPYGVIGPLAAPGSEPGFRFFALGWPQRTPTAQRALAAAGLPDLVRALGDPRVRLLAPPEAAPWIEQYARQHRDFSLVLVQEGSVPRFGVFRGRLGPSGVAGDRVLRSEPSGPE